MSATLIAVVAVVAILAFVAVSKKGRSDTGNAPMPDCYAKKILTTPEQALYFRLIEALPDHITLAQVQLSQLVGLKKGPTWQTWFNKISRKSVDYAICRKDFSVIAAVELDDKSHDAERRQAADADKDTALEAAGIRIIRWNVKNIPDKDEIRRQLISP